MFKVSLSLFDYFIEPLSYNKITICVFEVTKDKQIVVHQK